jgi:hypothetical protein
MVDPLDKSRRDVPDFESAKYDEVPRIIFSRPGKLVKWGHALPLLDAVNLTLLGFLCDFRFGSLNQ